MVVLVQVSLLTNLKLYQRPEKSQINGFDGSVLIWNNKPSWHSKHNLATLKDVQTYYAEKLSSFAVSLAQAWYLMMDFPEMSEAQKENASRQMAKIAIDADSILLSLTAKHAKKFNDLLANLKTKEEKDSYFDELQNRFDDEIESVKFLMIKSDKISFFENSELAGSDFKANFPKANAELIEAGNCLALDRYTGCVCHLMRALEHCLKSIEDSLKIPSSDNPWENTWGKVLKRIESKKGNGTKQCPPSAEWQHNPDFYSKCYYFINGIKIPYRDSTFHVTTVYDEESASSVFTVAVEAFRFFPSHLKEKS